ncbi:MAG: replication-associated recombination protein A, partial [Balneolaceae bacterium]|nr:replication-associated recombination protein A [Balneolaceae bacterium]
ANKLASMYLDAKNASDDYKYPHSFNRHWVPQQYLPDEYKEKTWYESGTEGREPGLLKRLNEIKNRKEK